MLFQHADIYKHALEHNTRHNTRSITISSITANLAYLELESDDNKFSVPLGHKDCERKREAIT